MKKIAFTTGMEYERKTIPSKTRQKVFEIGGWRCHYCWIDLKERKNSPTIDHLIQAYQGGTNDIENLIPCCRRCNSSRGGLTENEFSLKRVKERNKRMSQIGKLGGNRTAIKGKEFYSRISKLSHIGKAQI